MFRQYSSTQGRWMMPDPAGMAAVDPSNPQTWNRYAYVGNDPLSRVDPLGLDFADCYMCQAFSAENRNIDLSADAQTRAFFGDKYSDLPGKSNPILQGLRDYITDLDGPKDFIGEFQLSNEELGIVAANNGFTWAWNFTKSLFGGFTIDTGSGSCIGVALDSAQPVLSAAKKVQDYSKQYAAPIVASLPGNGASLSSGMYAMANYAGQMKASPGDVALFTAGAGAINVAASNLSAWGATALAKTPTTLAIAGDAALAYGVYQEAKAALSGKCH